MWLRRSVDDTVPQAGVGDLERAAAWDGLPKVVAAHVVIRAERAGDLTPPQERRQVA